MQIRSKNALFVAAVASLLGSAAYGATITQWNFNSVPADGTLSTGTLTPSIGSGTGSLVGTTSTFATGSLVTDPAADADDTGLNTSGYPTQSTGSGTEGVQFLASTAGFNNITISYDHRASGTASRWSQLEYTTNGGSSWTSLGNNSGGLSPHDTFYSFSNAIPAAANNQTGFGIRILSIFSPLLFDQNTALTDFAANTAYMRANAEASFTSNAGTGTSNYGTGGTWRFDMVTVSGTVASPSSFVTLTNTGTPTFGTLSIVGGSGNYTLQNVATSAAKSGVLGISGDLAASTDAIWVYLDLATLADQSFLTSSALGSPVNLTSISDVAVTIGGITYDKLLQFNNTVATNDFFAFDFNSLNGGAGVSINNIAVVPEPATFGLLTVGGLALLARRRRA